MINPHSCTWFRKAAGSLSAEAQRGLDAILEANVQLWGLVETSNGSVRQLCDALKAVPDIRKYFPKGKWATIQHLEGQI